MLYVIIACHFRSEKELCKTTIARLRHTLKVVEDGDQILVTGDVPYMFGSSTLGELMRDWLVKNGFPAEDVYVLAGGVGTFSDARIACKFLKHEKKVVIVSSPWYFFQGKLIWQRRARENNISISFINVPNTGGLRTVLVYAAIGIMVRSAIFFGLERTLENVLTASQQKRTRGFTFDGCR